MLLFIELWTGPNELENKFFVDLCNTDNQYLVNDPPIIRKFSIADRPKISQSHKKSRELKVEGNKALASASSCTFHRSTCIGSGVMAAGSAGCVGIKEAKTRTGIEVGV